MAKLEAQIAAFYRRLGPRIRKTVVGHIISFLRLARTYTPNSILKDLEVCTVTLSIVGREMLWSRVHLATSVVNM